MAKKKSDAVASAADDLYTQLSQLPPDEIAQIIEGILPMEELCMRLDGTSHVVRVHGLRIFDVSSLLKEAGIPDDDPRSDVYSEIRGGLIDREIINKLRSAAAKERTLCRRAGAVQIWIGSRQGWWVPIGATTRFDEAVEELKAGYQEVVEQYLLNDYENLRAQAETNVRKAAASAWKELRAKGKTDASQEDFVAANLQLLERKFPSKNEIPSRIYIEAIPTQRPLPPRVQEIMLEIREREARLLDAQMEIAYHQQRMVALDVQLQEQKLRDLADERAKRDDVLRQAIAPEIEAARRLVIQMEADIMCVAQEIIQAAQKGVKVTGGTAKSWRQTLESLKLLAPDNAQLMNALQSIQEISRRPDKTGQAEIAVAQQQVHQALVQLEQRSRVTIQADALWQLISANQGEEALRQIGKIKAGLTDKMDEIEALEYLFTEIGAQDT